MVEGGLDEGGWGWVEFERMDELRNIYTLYRMGKGKEL